MLNVKQVVFSLRALFPQAIRYLSSHQEGALALMLALAECLPAIYFPVSSAISSFTVVSLSIR